MCPHYRHFPDRPGASTRDVYSRGLTGNAPPPSRASFLGSLKGQIRILGLMVLVSFGLATIVAIGLLRESSSLQVSNTSRSLEGELDEIVGAYFVMRQPSLAAGAPGPIAAGDEEPLRRLMSEALSDDRGMAGGFFDPDGAKLLGYSFPTSHGSDRQEPSTRMREAAAQVSKDAMTRPKGSKRRFDLGGTTLMFRARVLKAGGAVDGVVWVAEGIPGVVALRGRTLRMSFLILIGLSIVATALAWRFTHQLDQAVGTIEGALAAKEARPDAPVPPTRFEEIDRIGAGSITSPARSRTTDGSGRTSRIACTAPIGWRSWASSSPEWRTRFETRWPPSSSSSTCCARIETARRPRPPSP